VIDCISISRKEKIPLNELMLLSTSILAFFSDKQHFFPLYEKCKSTFVSQGFCLQKKTKYYYVFTSFSWNQFYKTDTAIGIRVEGLRIQMGP
jgi:hypothetical protein